MKVENREPVGSRERYSMSDHGSSGGQVHAGFLFLVTGVTFSVGVISLVLLAQIVQPHHFPAGLGLQEGERDNEVASGPWAKGRPLVGMGAEQWGKVQARIKRKLKNGPKDPQDQPAEAAEFYLEQRTRGAPLDYALLQKARGQIERMPQAAFTPDGLVVRAPGDGVGASTKAVGNITGWTELGPGNIGGRTRALLIEPGNPLIMYAGGVAGGVWKTADGGASWTALDDLMDNLAVVTMAFERQGSGFENSATIYAGTGEGYFNGDAVRGAGIFKSTDSGATWTQLASTNSFNFRYVNKIVASPNDAGVVYAATRTGVWKTSDSGVNWTSVLANDGSGGANGTRNVTGVGITDVEIRTDLPTDTLIASAGSFSTDGIYRSADAGATWTRVFTITGLGRSDLAIAPSNQDVMYALSADSQNDDRLLNVFKSVDGGATWLAQIPGAFDQRSADWLLLTNPVIANDSPCFGEQDSLLHQGWYDNTIAVSPTNENVVFAGGIDLFRSDDGGATWGVISYWWLPLDFSEYAHADQHTIVFHPGWDGAVNQTLFVGNDGGIFETGNALAAVASGGNDGICFGLPSIPTQVSWLSLNNSYGVTQFYHGRPFPSPDATYFGGTQDNGTLMSGDASGVNGWFEIAGGDGGYVSYDPLNTLTLFSETTELSILRSTDGGASFFDITPNGISEDPANFLFINPFRHDPGAADVIWTGGFFPWRSTNASTQPNPALVTWVQAGAITTGFGRISAWAIDPGNGNHVVLGLSAGEVQRETAALSTGQADEWPIVTPPWNGFAFVSWVEFDPNDGAGNTWYVTNSLFGSGKKVFKTIDDGVTWIDLTSNLPDIPAHCLVVQPGFANNLFVGTDLGVFVSRNGGTSWANMNTPDFTNAVVEALEFQDSTTLYAFTHGRGAWRATVDVTVGPTVSSITRANGDRTNAASVDFTVAFSEGVTGVDAFDFTVSTGGLSGTSVSGISETTDSLYTVSVNTGSGDGTIRLDLIDDDSIVDDVGDPLGGVGLGNGDFTTGEVYTIDKTTPTISIGSPSDSTATGGPISYTVTYTDANPISITLSASDVTLNSSGTATGAVSVSGAGTTTRSVTIDSISGDGAIGISVAAGTASDGAGNSAPAAGPSDTFVVDNTGPTADTVTPATTGPTNAASVDFTVTFSENVVNFNDASDVVITHGGTLNTGLAITGGPTTYTVSVTGISGDGSFTLAVNAGSDVQDLASNALFASVTSAAVSIDNTAEVSIGAPSASVTAGGPITYTVTYTGVDSVTLVVGDVTLRTTGTALGTVIVSGTGTAIRTVTIDTISGDGTLGISIGAGTASDAAENSTAAAGPSTTFTVDNTAPGISIGEPSISVTSGGPVRYTLAYTGADFVELAVGDVTLDTTGTASGAIGVSGTGTSTRTVTLDTVTGEGTIGISIAPGTASDQADNAAPGAGPSATFTVALPPEISTHPVSLTVEPGESVIFLVAASGTAPLRYQWRKDGVDLAGETAATFTIASAQKPDRGKYDCLVDNIVGSVTSLAASLSVIEPLECGDLPLLLEQLDDFYNRFGVRTGDIDSDEFPEAASLALIEFVLCLDDGSPLWGATMSALNINLKAVDDELPFRFLVDSQEVIAALIAVSNDTREAVRSTLDVFGLTLSSTYEVVTCLSSDSCAPAPMKGAPLNVDYKKFAEVVRGINEPYSGDGDLDGDGIINRIEYANVIDGGGSLEDFAIAAFDPALGGAVPAIEGAAEGSGEEEGTGEIVGEDEGEGRGGDGETNTVGCAVSSAATSGTHLPDVAGDLFLLLAVAAILAISRPSLAIRGMLR